MENDPEKPINLRRPLWVAGVLLLTLTLALFVGLWFPPLTALRAKSGPPHASSTPEPLKQVVGVVIDETTQAPNPRVTVRMGQVETKTDSEGRFILEPGQQATSMLLIKAPGYERRQVPPTSAPMTIALRKQVVKAAYLTYYGVGDKTIRSRVFSLLEKTELNAVVIDVKGDRGLIPYRTQVPLALEAGAQGPVIIKEFDQMLADLKVKGIYTIARIVVFKDNVLANAKPDLAVIDTRTGKPWLDNEKLAWVDPFREEVWNYTIAVAKEAAAKGFDEIQFDYVRFPTDGKLGAAQYSKPNTKETRVASIRGFLERAQKELGPTGVFLAADLFGYTAFNESDTDIGQRLEDLAPYLDYICPMAYPSGYHLGLPRYRNPVQHPYEVVFETVKKAQERVAWAGYPAKVRPWIQDFRDYAFDRRIFGVKEVRAQQRGAEEAGGTGWMLWNPRNDYTVDALKPKVNTAADKTGENGRSPR